MPDPAIIPSSKRVALNYELELTNLDDISAGGCVGMPILHIDRLSW